MIPLSDLRLMLVKVSPLGVSGDKIKAELQMAERLDMLEGCGEMPLRPPSVRGLFILWVADVRDDRKSLPTRSRCRRGRGEPPGFRGQAPWQS